MGFFKGLGHVLQEFGQWLENDPKVQNFNACAGCELQKIASQVLSDAQTKLGPIITGVEAKVNEIVGDVQTKINNVVAEAQSKIDANNICLRCSPPTTPPSEPPAGPSAPSPATSAAHSVQGTSAAGGTPPANGCPPCKCS